VSLAEIFVGTQVVARKNSSLRPANMQDRHRNAHFEVSL
jgi:hypothetical protein